VTLVVNVISGWSCPVGGTGSQMATSQFVHSPNSSSSSSLSLSPPERNLCTGDITNLLYRHIDSLTNFASVAVAIVWML